MARGEQLVACGDAAVDVSRQMWLVRVCCLLLCKIFPIFFFAAYSSFFSCLSFLARRIHFFIMLKKRRYGP